MTPTDDTPTGLALLWITADRQAALDMVLMYARNARLRGWWDMVHLVVWGPSAGLLAADAEVQAAVAACREAGVTLFACRACAERRGVADALEALGVEVIFMGEPLTGYLKDGWKVLSI